MSKLGLWQLSDDLADNYIAFKHLYEQLAQNFTKASGKPFDLYGVEHVFWFIGEHPLEAYSVRSENEGTSDSCTT